MSTERFCQSDHGGMEASRPTLPDVRLEVPHAVRRVARRLRRGSPGGSANLRYDELTVAVIGRTVRTGVRGVDVGAHRGDILRHLVAAWPDGRHVAVEPLPDLAERLRDEFPTVAVHEVALAATGGDHVEFHHVASNPAYSGLRRRRYDRPDETVEVIEVATATLDELLDDGGPPVGLLKIDVEGGELGVLAGAARTLDGDRPVVVFEHGLGAADHYGTRPEQVADLFDGHDYELVLLPDHLAGGAALSRDAFVEEFDTGRNHYFAARPVSRR